MRGLSKIKNVFRIINPFRYRTVLSDPVSRKEFYQEVSYINLNRVRVIGYFMLVLAAYSLYFDFSLGGFWETYQVSNFMLLDTALFFVGITIIIITHIFNPEKSENIRPWHGIFTLVVVMFHLIWSTAISIIESVNANGVPTYLVGVYSAATIYILRDWKFLILLTISLICLYSGLFYIGISFQEIVTQYMANVILVFLAWITSAVLFNTRMKSFKAKKDVELAKYSLDVKVKERTEELRKANIKLVEEIKERKQYEKGLQTEKKKAQEADRLKSVFLANMSHEIRTPLNGILGFGELLLNNELSNQKRSRYLEIINANGQQLLKIIDDIMDISMIESNQLKVNLVSFRLNHILPDAQVFFLNELQKSDKSNIRVINDGFPENSSDRVNSDPLRIQQVLYNLLSNATKFTRQGNIRFGGKVDDGLAMIYVEDTGIGIAPEQSEMIFERFRQGEESISRSYGGTGIGLSISKGMIELLNGHIWVDLTYKKGARFCFSLPTENFHLPLIKQITKNSFDILNNHDVIITGSEDAPDSIITDIIRYYKPDIRLLAVDTFSPESLDFNPRIILFDLPGHKGLRNLIGNTVNHFSKSIIIAAVEDNEEKIKIIKAGCKLVYTAPVNIQLLIIQLNQLLND
ncbi:MAG: hypothetical protein JW894_11690 [Bacteroidales bacterium]|nr:hypothetical protein [Bacteroidales bacterium]